eukprot:c1821_g1_i2.p1 GENE.c1821_g1_i2~~c1821_g1_i2.p1  ORF type:complete len:261 (-),score=49.92 c1821_g1_i2:48-830(-)
MGPRCSTLILCSRWQKRGEGPWHPKVTGRTLSEQEVFEIFSKLVKTMSREKFSYTTDERAYTKLAIATGCRNLHVNEMGGMKRKRIDFLAQVDAPSHIGDTFIRFLATNATSLELDKTLIHSSLAAYHNLLWTTSAESRRLCYLELKGPHREVALLNINTAPFCLDQGLAPMISPNLLPEPVLINHPGAAKIFRREIVAVLAAWYKKAESQDLEVNDTLALFNTIAESNFEKYLATFGSNLPVFTINFDSSASVFAPFQE